MKPEETHDPVLGKLVHCAGNDLFTLATPLEVPALRGTFHDVYLELPGPSRRVSAEQRKRVAWIRDAGPEIAREVQRAVFRYYCDHRERFWGETVELFGEEAAFRIMPPITHDEQIWLLISPFVAEVLQENHPFEYDVGLSFNATWDKEHGVEVKFRGSDVVAVHEQGVCGLG